MRHRKRSLFASVGALLAGVAHAQVTLDGTLGRAGPLPGPDYAITADLGRQVGGNLFHSFGLFSILTGESATFSGPNSVSNIISRVTGGQVSFIDGAIRSTIPGANLYLLNPAGVLFGENASLDMQGSFHVSSADFLRLGDGGRFDVRTPANSVLTVAPVTTFGFLSEAPGRIDITGSFLRIPEGQTLSLIGGDISLTNATLYAPAGRINVAAVASAGEVIPTDTDLSLQGFGALGTFTLNHTTEGRPMANVGEPLGEVELGNLDTSGAGGGAIFVRGGRWVSRGGWVLANTYGNRDGCEVDLDVGHLELSGGSLISTSTLGAGRGGDLTITARDAVTLAESSGLFARVAPSATGDAGSITLDVGRLELSGGGLISTSTFGAGRGGDLILTARDTVTIGGTDPAGHPSGLFASTNAGATGDAGSITLDVGRLELSGGGEIASSTWGAGRGGDLILTARDTVTIGGTDPAGHPSGLFASAEAGSTNDAGSITLDAGRLELSDGGVIATDTWGGGRGGDLTATARDAITISGWDPTGTFPSGLYASAAPGATGNAGDLTVTTPRLTLTDGGVISAQSTDTSGGNLTLNADYLQLWNGSAISSSVDGDPDTQGGNVTINSTNVVALNDSRIIAQANRGKGGNITLNTDVFLHDAASTADVVNASSQVTGNDGTVIINAPETDISGSLTALPVNYLDVAGQLSRRCGTNDSDHRGRFTVQGRGALPPDPDELATARAADCHPKQSPPARATPAASVITATPTTAMPGFGDQ